MSHLSSYVIVAAVVFGLNLLPAFGPPTWAVLVFYRLTVQLNVIPLVLVGAVAAASGRLVLAGTFTHLKGRVSARTQANLDAAGKVLSRDRKRSAAGVALFALSPLPSAQLFEAAGLIGVSLRPLTAAFFAGRLVSYSIYVGGASAAASTSIGHLVTSSFTSPWGIALQVVLLGALALLTRIDWIGRHKRHEGGRAPEASV
jgi:uncharacterized membrane protein YdjX (TVP38/TMEM64 family)